MGCLPTQWKESVIVPVCKDQSFNLTRRRDHRDEATLKEKSGFRKERSTTDPGLCLESEIRKAQVIKASMVAAFFILREPVI